MSYDKLYSNGGFKYSSSVWLPRIQKLVDKHGIEGRVLDAPAGDGFWSRLLRMSMNERQKRLQSNVSPTVKPVDLSEIGCEKSNGVLWNLNQFNPKWVGEFDWIFCRGISHLHHEHIDTTPFTHFNQYSSQWVVIYSTTQTSAQSKSGHHWNHTKKQLDNVLIPFVQPGECWTSYIEYGQYHFVKTFWDMPA
jgi:hypothetical protein